MSLPLSALCTLCAHSTRRTCKHGPQLLLELAAVDPALSVHDEGGHHRVQLRPFKLRRTRRRGDALQALLEGRLGRSYRSVREVRAGSGIAAPVASRCPARRPSQQLPSSEDTVRRCGHKREGSEGACGGGGGRVLVGTLTARRRAPRRHSFHCFVPGATRSASAAALAVSATLTASLCRNWRGGR